MADNISHSVIGAAIAIGTAKLMPESAFLSQAAAISAVSFLSHFALDAAPHGHAKRMRLEVGAGLLTILLLLAGAIVFADKRLFWLLFIGIFFANVFDVFLNLSKLFPENHLAGKILGFDRSISWFKWSRWSYLKPELFHEDWIDRDGRKVAKFNFLNFIVIGVSLGLLVITILF